MIIYSQGEAINTSRNTDKRLPRQGGFGARYSMGGGKHYRRSTAWVKTGCRMYILYIMTGTENRG
jgi:hypothetical protein